MDWTKISDKEYHTILRHYRAYLNLIVEDNAESDERVYPKPFDDYAIWYLKEKAKL